MSVFAKALGLEAFRGDRSARRVISSLQEDHVGTCIAAYATPQVYDWLDRKMKGLVQTDQAQSRAGSKENKAK